MGDTTSNRSYPYPESTDDFRPYQDIQALAEAVDADVEAVDARVAVLEGPPSAMIAISHTFPSGSIDQVTFGSPMWNVGGLYTTGNQFVVPVGEQGLFEAGLIARFASQATAAGLRNMRVYKNGVEEMSFTWPTQASLNNTNITVSGAYPLVLADGDIVTYWGVQNSGVSLALTGNSRAWLRRLDQ